jgi:hypothetical protein
MGAVKREISFKNLDDQEVTETWYFSLDEEDAANTDLAHRPDLSEYLAAVDKNRDAREVMNIWKTLLWASVGKREGNLLVKDEQVLREFKFGGAYKQLFAELVDDPNAGMDFFLKIMPDKVQKKVAEEQAKTYDTDQMMAMSQEEFDAVFGTDDTKWDRDVLLVAMRRKNAPKSNAA